MALWLVGQSIKYLPSIDFSYRKDIRITAPILRPFIQSDVGTTWQKPCQKLITIRHQPGGLRGLGRFDKLGWRLWRAEEE